MTTRPTDWLTQAEAAAHLRIGVRTFRKRLKAKKVHPGYLSSDKRRVWDPRDLDASIKGDDLADHSEPHTDPIMAAINAAEAKAAAARRAQSREG